MAELDRGELTVSGVAPDLFREGYASGRMRFRTAVEDAGEADVIVICVPTPLRDGAPDLTYIE